MRGGSDLARRLGVSELRIGLTVVAVGTSAPELAVGIDAAWRGDGDIAFGNAVGSNLANLGLLLGPLAVWRPLVMERTAVRRELPTLVLVTLLSAGLAVGPWSPGGAAGYARADAVVLLAAFALANLAALGETRRARRSGLGAPPPGSPARDVLCIAAGCVALAAGSELAVPGAVRLAARAGVPEELVALSLLAIGTSLPELVTSAVAIARGRASIGVGNLVGSCLANLTLVLGLSALAGPIALPANGYLDLGVAGALALAAALLAYDGRLGRPGGALLAALYLGYLSLRFAGAAG